MREFLRLPATGSLSRPGDGGFVLYNYMPTEDLPAVYGQMHRFVTGVLEGGPMETTIRHRFLTHTDAKIASVIQLKLVPDSVTGDPQFAVSGVVFGNL